MDEIWDVIGDLFSRYVACCFLILVMVFVMIVCVPLGGLAAAYGYHDGNPQGWEAFWTSYLLAGAGSGDYVLTGPGAAKVAELGYDPGKVAGCIEAIKWVKENQHHTIDLGLCLSIWQLEGIGHEDGLANACKYSPQQCQDAKWLLARWQSFDTRSLDSRVSDLVSEGYTG